MNKKRGLIFLTFLLFGILFISYVNAAETSYCCEKTKEGAWCQNVPLSSCDSGFNSQPTSCDNTAYCQLGTCVDQSEGRCMPNTPEKVCGEEGGIWYQESPSELAECSYGCCLYGGQTSFVTQTRCGILGSFYGLETIFRGDITSELQCLGSSNLEVKGACVYENEYNTRTCKLLTKSECNELEGNTNSDQITFNEGYLCTAQFLQTECKPSTKTTCVEGFPEVYFTDTCGNLANIYDSSKENYVEDLEYWTKIIAKDESCKPNTNNGNANDKSCGNCEYLKGSMCASYEKDVTAKPDSGDYICKDLGCEYDLNQDGKIQNNEKFKHGETWCDTTNKQSLGDDIFLPGTESYLLKCYNGEVLKEGCSVGEWRQKICKEVVTNDIHQAACTANIWQDCMEQTTEEECTDEQVRDCIWYDKTDYTGAEPKSIYKDADGNPLTVDKNGNTIKASCVPKYSPAYDFWNPEGELGVMASFGDELTIVPFAFPLLGGPWDRDYLAGNTEEDRKERQEYCGSYDSLDVGKADPVEECKALNTYKNHNIWRKVRDDVCIALGDTSLKTNYLGYEGRYNLNDSLIYKFVKKGKELQGELEEFTNE
ncbi:hypothetical protein GW932_04060 [archaeon]|nr:hypothetical protein [archaeon]